MAIENDRQYQITKEEATKFENSIKKLEEELAHPADSLFRKVQLDAMRSQLADLQADLREYEMNPFRYQGGQ